ncbi:MAG: hypothetical protein EXR98_03475 [Gemmataceae bacterium]|nr:hypothetical protein [Gemmataceae bacterium]
MLAYFSLSLFVSAALLFLVQPMIGKMILPQLGGTPAVWNTCMVFFQGVLLVGYGYTHLLTTTQPARRQVLIQGILLFVPFVVLPFSVGDWEPPSDSNPVFALLGKLLLMVGLPFFLVSTTAPLLQKWFFHTGHPAAKDPYFLYGASNFGSMLGLAIYPTVIEPWLQVTPAAGASTWQTQVHLWTFLYALFVALVVGCAVIVWQALAGKWASDTSPPAPLPGGEGSETSAPEPKPAPAAAQATAVTAAAPKRRGVRIDTGAAAKPPPPTAQPSVSLGAPNDNLTLMRRLRWIGLAAAPSSLMLGATTYLTTDIAAVAFFWIIPLTLYLLTFIFVFAKWPWVWTGTPHTTVMFIQPCLLLFLVLKMVGNLSLPGDFSRWDTVITFVLHLAAFFSTTLMCHGELAKDRPSTKYLTEFYFWMSLGGVLGGLFNALFAPIAFQNGLWEYSIAMAFACVLRSNLVDQDKTLIPNDSTAERATRTGYTMDYSIPVAMGLVCYLMFYLGDYYPSSILGLKKSYPLAAMVILTLALSLRPVRFGLAVAALFLASGIYEHVYSAYVYEGRGFYGLVRVRLDPEGWRGMPKQNEDELIPYEWKVYRTLIHGGINHGRQVVRYKYMSDRGVETDETPEMNLRKRREPITYFHERNGIAEIFYKLTWPKAQPVSASGINMCGRSDARLPAAMFGLAFGESAPWAMLANTQSEPPFAVMGLGTGILASYAKPYQRVDIYEIDPLVKHLSIPAGYRPPWDPKRDPNAEIPEPTFYFVQDAMERHANVDVKLGDGRLVMKREAPQKYYHVIVLDAFSSDAIPVHLLTADAVKLYLDKLADGGILIFNTTNRYVRIEGVLAAIARDLDLDCLHCPDWGYNTERFPDSTDHPDRYSADWIILQRKVNKDTYVDGGAPIRERLEKSRKRLDWKGRIMVNSQAKEMIEERWQDVAPLDGPAWTDGYSNLLNPKVMPWIMPWRR